MTKVTLVQEGPAGELDTIRMREKPENGDNIHDPGSDCYFHVEYVSGSQYESTGGVFYNTDEYTAWGNQNNGEWVGRKNLIERIFG